MLPLCTDLVVDKIITYLNLRDIYFLKIVNGEFYNFKIINWHEYPYRSRLDLVDYLYNLKIDEVWEDPKLIESLGLNSLMINKYTDNVSLNIFNDKIETLIIKRVYNPSSFYFRGKMPDLEYFSILNIKTLEISYTDCNYLPKEIGKLSHLDTLLVNNNKFRQIPNPVFNLVNLNKLDLHSNPISLITSPMLNLTELVYLDISNTLIDTIENIPLFSLESVIVNGLDIKNIDDSYCESDILKII